MANVDNEIGKVSGVSIVQRFINYASTRFAPLKAAILYNSGEAEIATAASPLYVAPGTGATFTKTSEAKAMAAAFTHAPAAATAAVVTLSAPGAGVSNVLAGVYWSYDADPTGGGIVITDDGNNRFSVDITRGGPGFLPFDPPIKGTANKVVVVTLASGAGTVVGKVNVNAWTE